VCSGSTWVFGRGSSDLHLLWVCFDGAFQSKSHDSATAACVTTVASVKLRQCWPDQMRATRSAMRTKFANVLPIMSSPL
jgi:hypothetical protein